jgi:IclR family KDG regulon transcriptional repressor
MAGKRSALIQTAHPYLETINEKTKLSAFIGLRSGRRAILIDKVDSAYGILAGAGIKVILSQLSDEGIDEILARTELIKVIRAVGLTRPFFS